MLDFAYSVHTDIGNHTTGALINGVEVPISTELQNGDRIHIITNPEVFPQPTWLKWAKTSKARLELRSYFKTQRMVESATLGEQLLSHAIEALGLPYPEDIKDGWEKLIADAGCKTRDELHTEIGLGIRHANITAQRWLLLTQQHNNFAHNAVLQASEHALVKPEAERLVIRGDEVNTLVLSKCCRPIRGDAIIGFLQRKQGLVIHTADCLVARKQRTADNLRWIDLEWDKKAELSTTFPASVSIIAANEKGLLAKIAGEISESGANIADVVLETVLDDVRINIILDVNDRIHLAQVFKSVRSLGQVKKIARRFTSPK